MLNNYLLLNLIIKLVRFYFAADMTIFLRSYYTLFLSNTKYSVFLLNILIDLVYRTIKLKRESLV